MGGPETVVSVVKGVKCLSSFFRAASSGTMRGGGAILKGTARGGANIGTKLEYTFGKATGSAHNIERSTGMLR